MGKGIKDGKIKKDKSTRLKDSERNLINAASRIVIAETLLYMHEEYGYGGIRLNRVFDEYVKVLEEFAVEFRKTYKHPGIYLPIGMPIIRSRAEKIIGRKIKEAGPSEYAQQANLFCISTMTIALNRSCSFGKKRLQNFIEGVEAMIEEINNPRQRTTPDSLYEWCMESTGVDVRKVA